MSDHLYEVEIHATDAHGSRGVTHIEYRTRLPKADDVPHEIVAELEKALGRDHVTAVDADR
jgi:hypothetical protein